MGARPVACQCSNLAPSCLIVGLLPCSHLTASLLEVSVFGCVPMDYLSNLLVP
jgi:hypothetical protein